MKDILQQMFDLQYEFNKQFEFKDITLEEEPHKLKDLLPGMNIQEFLLGVITESTEALNEVPWKWWKDINAIDRDKIREEIIDIWHFLISASLAAGMSAQDVYKIYLIKLEKNYERQRLRKR